MAIKIDYGNDLVISDLQIPFELDKALDFCKRVCKEYKIPRSRFVYNVGDELDQYWASIYPKSVEAEHTAKQEYEESLDKLKKWYEAFPKMKLALSNHGQRWIKKATQSEIPSWLLKDYKTLIKAPRNWHWRKYWFVKNRKNPYIVEHGDDYGGKYPHITAAMTNMVSTVIGHHHTIAGVKFIENKGTEIHNMILWAAASGSLINFEKYAFQYARQSKNRPCLGLIILKDSGRTPVWIPFK